MPNYCVHHEEISGKVHKVEEAQKGMAREMDEKHEQITDLYDKHNESVNEYKLIIAQLTRMETNQVHYINDIKHLCTTLTDHITKSDTTFVEIAKAISDINRFKWFRDRINKLRDNLPGIIFWIVLGLIVMLVIAHDISAAKIIKFFRGG
jgi:uncharacterized coiled-coil DUF342 family protein